VAKCPFWLREKCRWDLRLPQQPLIYDCIYFNILLCPEKFVIFGKNYAMSGTILLFSKKFMICPENICMFAKIMICPEFFVLTPPSDFVLRFFRVCENFIQWHKHRIFSADAELRRACCWVGWEIDRSSTNGMNTSKYVISIRELEPKWFI
jgi:hypothetical protein